MKFTNKELELICGALRHLAGDSRAITGKLSAGNKLDKLADKIEKELLK